LNKILEKDYFKKCPCFGDAWELTNIYGDLRMIELMLNSKIFNVDTLFEHNETALTNAIRRDSMNIVKLLLDAGANINHLDEFGRSYFKIALDQKHSTLIYNFLVMYNYDFRNIRTPMRTTIYDVIDSYDDTLIKNIMNKKDFQNDMIDIIYSDKYELLNLILKNDHFKKCPCFKNIWEKINIFGSYRTIQLALDSKIFNVDTMFKNKETALTNAIQRNSIDIVKLLLDAGANIKHVDGFGRIYTQVALDKRNIDIHDLLLKHWIS
jgi:ankyrin repeat protein